MNEKVKEVTIDQSVKGAGTKVFQGIVAAILIFLSLMSILPFLMLISSSLSENSALITQGYGFFPKEFSTYAYEWLFVTNRDTILRAYGLTILVTVVGTALSLLITPLYAYPCSRPDYSRAGFFTFVCFFTMLFSGGMVGSYIIYTKVLNLKNTFWALIIPGGLMNAFNVILFKNSFSTNIHPALIEAARLDGASDMFIYSKIVIPLSLPIMATVGLMTGIGFWNNWMSGMYYITDSKLYTLQVMLQKILENITQLMSLGRATESFSQSTLPGATVRMAMAVIGTLPILVLYPFFSKAFVAGISLGGVKE